MRQAWSFTAALALGAAVVLSGGAAMAQETAVLDTGNTAWLLTSTALVLMMTIPGVALFYGGMVQKKNVLATLMQSFAVTCLISIVWMVLGYSLAFSSGGSVIGGFDRLFLSGITVDTLTGTIPESVFVIFQMTFAIIAAALVTGAIAERMKFSALLIFLGAWSLLVYAPVAYWVWGGGFLSTAGVLDFAGGTVVHINSGIAGLVAAIVVGKRVGFGKDVLAPHNLTYSVVGAALLWVGWFGFNAGSALAADGAAGMAMMVTQVATAAGALTWMFAEWGLRGKPSVLGVITGAIAGLVAITPASGFVGPGGALAIGILATLVCYFGATWLKNRLGYDDSLDVFAVHGLGGITGAILTGVFAVEAIGGTPGAIEGNFGQILTQFYGVGVTVVWCAVVSFVLLKIIGVVVGLSASEDDQREGLDVTFHGERVS